MGFQPNRKFKRKYNKLFCKDPEAANLFLLLCEIADGKGHVETTNKELVLLFNARFNHPEEYAL